MAEITPFDRVVSIWKSGDGFRLAEIDKAWPELAVALDELTRMHSHIITAESGATVPTIAPAVPGSGPRSHSATRSGASRMEPTSANPSGPQMPLFQEPEVK